MNARAFTRWLRRSFLVAWLTVAVLLGAMVGLGLMAKGLR